MWPVEARMGRCHMGSHASQRRPVMTNPLVELSDHTARIVEGVAGRIVAVHGGGRWSTSGIHWRPGIIVTAEEALERDENIDLTLPGGRRVSAALAGRDPSTDVA